jgi:hypothetical protein
VKEWDSSFKFQLQKECNATIDFDFKGIFTLKMHYFYRILTRFSDKWWDLTPGNAPLNLTLDINLTKNEDIKQCSFS